MRVRCANKRDVSAILALGSDPSFVVSERIRFYEKEELLEWVSLPDPNILLVAEDKREICGFLFCKKMSCHWAMLDNFYVEPAFRKSIATSLLLQRLTEELKCRRVSYLSILVDSQRRSLVRLARLHGFQESKQYVWLEMNL